MPHTWRLRANYTLNRLVKGSAVATWLWLLLTEPNSELTNAHARAHTHITHTRAHTQNLLTHARPHRQN